MTDTKTWCRVCGDKFSNENFEIGICCGYLLQQVPLTLAEQKAKLKEEIVLRKIIERAQKLRW